MSKSGSKKANIPNVGCDSAAVIIRGARLSFDCDFPALFGDLISDKYKRQEDVFDDMSMGITFKDVPYVLWHANNISGAYIYLIVEYVVVRIDEEESCEIGLSSRLKRVTFDGWLTDNNIPANYAQYLLLIHPR